MDEYEEGLKKIQAVKDKYPKLNLDLAQEEYAGEVYKVYSSCKFTRVQWEDLFKTEKNYMDYTISGLKEILSIVVGKERVENGTIWQSDFDPFIMEIILVAGP